MWRFALSGRWWAGHALVTAGVVVCLVLGRWQWDRAHSVTGDWQNLGYALQWPLFALVLVAGWLRFLWLERSHRAADEAAAVTGTGATGTGVTGTRATGTAVSEGPEGPSPGRRPRDAWPPRPAATWPPTPAAASAPPTLESDPDDELAAYNAYLAHLAAEDRRLGR